MRRLENRGVSPLYTNRSFATFPPVRSLAGRDDRRPCPTSAIPSNRGEEPPETAPLIAVRGRREHSSHAFGPHEDRRLQRWQCRHPALRICAVD